MEASKKYEFVGGDFKKYSEFEQLVFENKGYFSSEDYMEFKSGEDKILVDYDLDVTGKIDIAKGDYFTSDHTQVDISDVSVDIKFIVENDVLIDITSDIKSLMCSIINENINNGN